MARDSAVEKTDRELLEEMVNRSRRIETRVTVMANHIGVDAGGEKPVFDVRRNTVNVPTRKVSLEDVLQAIPATTTAHIDVACNGDYLMTVYVN